MVTAKWDSYKSPNSNSVHNTDGQTRKAVERSIVFLHKIAAMTLAS